MIELPAPNPGEFLPYESEGGRARVKCRFAEDTLWLSQAMTAELFQTLSQNITLHRKALYSELEIAPEATCKSYLQVQPEGGSVAGYPEFPDCSAPTRRIPPRCS